ncbi:hypothetical protein H0H81_008494, partial [Sphagnurus paluster]
TIGKTWHLKFEQHHPELIKARPTKLDAKRAENFNEATIKDHFDKLYALDKKHGGIPPEHIWNMDEKGIQLGGGRGKQRKKFYFTVKQKYRQRIGSDNLELVTVLECVSAAGAVVPPSFCLKEGARPDIRELGDDEFGRSVSLLFTEFFEY